MGKKVAMVGLMVVGIAIMLWAGWHNLRERKLAAQRAATSHMVLVPEGATGADAGAGETAAPGSDAASKLMGKAAPEFTLTSLDGKKVSLKEYRGKAVMVNFWATWCAPCKLEMPWFAEFAKQYGPQGLVILGIDQDPEAGKDKIAATAERLGVNYPILLPNDAVAPAYGGIDYLPSTFYVDRNGVVQEVTAGLASKDEVEAHIKKLLASGAGKEQALLEPVR